MTALAIRATGVGKRYRLGNKAERYLTLRDTIASATRTSLDLFHGRPRRYSPPGTDVMWALRDVCFEVRPGEMVGLIGRNGAGKSTLLKLLSRITDPTEGWIDVRGRVGSLLEVGTGFHSELTGRENIFLSGAILGMKRAEIIAKFDEIVAFAEVERFVDTPVKHYSSGMYLRLAFAVAAHLEPEILLVDEVLAVGDARFQRKCLDRMQAVGREGRTVLFVSHNMPTITRLCPRAILINDGTIAMDGPSDKAVSSYLGSAFATAAARVWTNPGAAPGSETVRLRGVRVLDKNGEIATTIDIRDPVAIEVEYDVLTSGHILMPHFLVHTVEGVLAFVGLDQDPAWRARRRPIGRYRSTGWIPGNLLSEGLTLVGPAMRSVEPDMKHFYERDAISFQVVDAPGQDTARGDYAGAIPGAVRPRIPWTTEFEPAQSDQPLAAAR